MHCPFCRHTDTKVLDSRVAEDGCSIRRRRCCQACEQRFTPGETYLITDDRPIARREYYELLARFTAAPPPKFSDDELSDLNKRISNRKAREHLPLRLAYPTIVEGLPQAIGGENP